MIRLLFVLVFICITPLIVCPRLRDHLMPWAFAYVILWALCKSFIGSYILQKTGDISLFAMYGVIVNGFRNVRFGRDKLFTLITVLAGYKILSCSFGDFMLFNMVYDACWYFEFIAVGYCMGLWITCEPGRFQKVLAVVTGSSLIAAILYLHTNVFAVTYGVDDGLERTQIEFDYASGRKSSINGLAMSIAAYLFFPFMHILWGRIKKGALAFLVFLLLLSISGFVILVFGITMLKTGCRNAMLPIIVYGLYFLCGKWGNGGTLSRILKKTVLGVIMVSAVLTVGSRFFGAGYEFRSFDFFAERKGTVAGDITTGRTHIWKEWIDSMEDFDYFIGAGAVPRKMRHWHFENGDFFVHNSYVQLFVQTGVTGCLIFMVLSFSFCKRLLFVDDKFRHIAIALFLSWFLLGMSESLGFVFAEQIAKLNFGLALGLVEFGVPIVGLSPFNKLHKWGKEKCEYYG